LDEGVLALKICQKHIKVADRSRFGWGTINHYKSGPLTDDEDDEKHLHRSEKEVKHDYEELEEARKRRRGGSRGGFGGYRKRPYNLQTTTMIPRGMAPDPVEQITQWLTPPVINVLDTPETAEQAKGSGTLF